MTAGHPTATHAATSPETALPRQAAFAFLSGGGQLGQRIAAFDWSGTGLGALDQWPPHVQAATAFMLRSQVAIVMLWGEAGVMVYNDAYAVFAGVRHPQLLGSNVREGWDEVADFNDNVMRVGLSGGTLSYRDQRLTLQRNGRAEPAWMDLDYSPLLDAVGEPAGVMAIVVETTVRVQAERQRMAAERRRELLMQLTDGFRDVNDPVEVGYVAAELIGRVLGVGRVGYGTIDHTAETLHVQRDWTASGVETLAGTLNLRDFGSFIDDMKRDEFISIADVRVDARTAAAAAELESRSARSFVNAPVVEQGRLVAVLYINHFEPRDWSPEDLDLVREITVRTHTAVERVRIEAALREAKETLEAKVEARTRELLEVEARFRQSQKMEAIGQLTGGLAHDFNNLLAAMSASLQVLQKRLLAGQTDNVERYIGMAQESVRRAASLTQRLLAFSRRQTLDPRAIDVNRLVGGLEELIRRTVGPSVEVEVVGAGGLWLTRVDVSQLENAVLNLCINARDAMSPDGGRLTIETANKWLDDRAAAERELPPGQYVSLCVTDTGVGMTPDVIARAFDPFFTTKPMGQGTGLGLSMVYGFVRQSGGQVRVYSEVGCGTTMCLYLPRHVGEADPDTDSQPALFDDKAAGETVLVIEDEKTIRTLIGEELRGLGYTVITAVDGNEGLTVLQSDRRIDLLLTDVGLPGGLNGRQVADAGRVPRPDLKVLFITGYAENAAVGNGLLERGMEVITKPFDIGALAKKVREMVER